MNTPSDNLRNKLIIDPNFEKTINSIKKINIRISETPKPSKYDFSNTVFPPNGVLKPIEKIASYNLDPQNGQLFLESCIVSGYDESKLEYKSLEGNALFTAHTIAIASKKVYIPVSKLTVYFFTGSKEIVDKYSEFQHSKDPKTDSNRKYVLDRSQLLKTYSLENSLLFVDGPLIGGNLTSYTISLVEELEKRNIIPIFFVKNSDSNLVIDNIRELSNRYNSDMHWSFDILRKGQRTNFFIYKDQHNPRNTKVFCYLKSFNVSPQRVEFYIDTFNHNKGLIEDIMDLIYYLMLVNGSLQNPQIRPIAIAEKYARNVIKMSNSYHLIKASGLIPTMNQERFG
jgi:hypothetical protein